MNIKEIVDTINPVIECDSKNKFLEVVEILGSNGYNVLCHLEVIDQTKPIYVFLTNGEVDYTNNKAVISDYEFERRFNASEFISSANQESIIELYFCKIDEISGNIPEKPVTFKCERFSELCDVLAILKQKRKVWIGGYDLFEPGVLNSLEALMRHPGNNIYITPIEGTGKRVTYDVYDEDPKGYMVIEPRDYREAIECI